MKKSAYACVIVIACFATTALRAQRTLVLHDAEENYPVSSHAYLFTGNTSLSTIDTVLKADTTKFSRNQSSEEIIYSIEETQAWCTFSVRNASQQQDWMLKIQQSRVDTAQLYVVRENGLTEKYPMT